MRHSFLVPFVIVGVGACASGGGAPTQPAPPPPPQELRAPAAFDDAGATARAAATIRPDAILEHIEYLASDQLGGRDTPSPGLEAAAEYLAAELEGAGLEPAGDEGSFFQRFPYTRTAMIRERRRVAYEGPSGAAELEFGRDYYVIPGQQVSEETQVIFGGPAGAPVAGLVQVARGNVLLFATDGNPVVGTGETLVGAFQAAAQGGAAAMVLLLDDTNAPDSIFDLASGIEGAGLATPIPIVGLSPERSRELLAAAGLDLSALRDAPPETALTLEGVAMTVAAPFEMSEHTPPNVIAMLRGRDPVLRDEYIVYTAHFDHVGIGMPNASGDSIYNGADDDASGTSVLLETAAAFAGMDVVPARSVIFLAVSGEEKGLVGSKYFSENPTVPIDGIIVNINLDMVGRNHPDTVIGVGRQYTNLGPITDRILEKHPELGFTVIEDPKPEDQAFFRSDHLHFVNKDIPAIFFTTWEHEDYHKPSDETHLIDSEKAARVAKMVFYLGARIASGEEDPEWTEDGLAEVRRIIAENGG